jgi:hypothetical protein
LSTPAITPDTGASCCRSYQPLHVHSRHRFMIENGATTLWESWKHETEVHQLALQLFSEVCVAFLI